MAYYSGAAYYLAEWANEENNRVKASHIARVADRMEQRYRDNHECCCIGLPWSMYSPYGAKGLRPKQPPPTRGSNNPPLYGTRPPRTEDKYENII